MNRQGRPSRAPLALFSKKEHDMSVSILKRKEPNGTGVYARVTLTDQRELMTRFSSLPRQDLEALLALLAHETAPGKLDMLLVRRPGTMTTLSMPYFPDGMEQYLRDLLERAGQPQESAHAHAIAWSNGISEIYPYLVAGSMAGQPLGDAIHVC
jgi:hypothetical protein